MANVFFSATMQKSPESVPARVMMANDLDRVVYVALRGSALKRDAFCEIVGPALIARVPFKRGNGEMVVCRYFSRSNELEHYDNYRAVLEHIYGEHCRTRVRLAWRDQL